MTPPMRATWLTRLAALCISTRPLSACAGKVRKPNFPTFHDGPGTPPRSATLCPSPAEPRPLVGASVTPNNQTYSLGNGTSCGYEGLAIVLHVFCLLTPT